MNEEISEELQEYLHKFLEKLFSEHAPSFSKDFSLRGDIHKGLWRIRVHDNYEQKRVGTYVFDESKKEWVMIQKVRRS